MRLHPHLSQKNDPSTQILLNLDYPNLTIVAPESEVDTYTLIKNSDKVVTFGSTVGIEATFWGVPAITAGKAEYMNMNATYEPKTHSELIALIGDNLKPKPQINAIKYGYYLKSFGIPFKYYKAENLFKGTFEGKEVKPKYFWINAFASQVIKGFAFLKIDLKKPFIEKFKYLYSKY